MSRSSTILSVLLVVWLPVVSSWAQVAADQGAPPPPPEAVVVASGTLFLYAKAKEDLLLLVFYDEFVAIINEISVSADANT